MKNNTFKIGGRIWKTVAAVFLCFLIDDIWREGVPFYAAIAAILCIQNNWEDSLKTAKNREIATIIGGIWGMLFLIFEKSTGFAPGEIIRYAILSLLLIPIIKLSVGLKQEKGTYLMCVVFLCVTVTHRGDVSPVEFAINRMIDTTIGIVVALAVNQFLHILKKKGDKKKRF